MLKQIRAAFIAFATATGVASAVYVLFVGPWQRRWGATDEEVKRPMPGDEEVPEPMCASTRAVTIESKPEDIWPWIVQIGTGKAGWYSYEWIERAMGLDVTNADRVIPEFQNLKVGDQVPLAPDFGIPVKVIEANRLLLLVGHDPTNIGDTSLAFALYPIDEQRTRLISRHRARWPKNLTGYITLAVIDPGSFIMMRKMLLGIKQRAEQTAKETKKPEKPSEAMAKM